MHMRIFTTLWIFVYASTLVSAQPVMSTGGKRMPAEWIDSATGHRVVRLTDRDRGSNLSFYFHNNPFIGDRMVYYGSERIDLAGVRKQEISSGVARNRQIHLMDLKTRQSETLTTHQQPMNGEIVHAASGRIFYQIRDTIFELDIRTRSPRKVHVFDQAYRGSVSTVNADGTMLAGTRSTEAERELFRKNPDKSSYFNVIYEAKLPRTIFTIDISTGKRTDRLTDTAWLNHLQFSPVDPDLLMFCHEGPWHKVDRIHTLNIYTGQQRIVHHRSMPMEIAGHEWFSHDGKTIWFDLQQPRSTTFYVCGADVETGVERKYKLKRDEWSIHFNLSNDQRQFCGDGGDPGQVARAKDGRWIYLFHPDGDSLRAQRLVDMTHHNYRLEPNVHFSPDDRWVIFRANFEGIEQIYAVDIRKNIK